MTIFSNARDNSALRRPFDKARALRRGAVGMGVVCAISAAATVAIVIAMPPSSAAKRQSIVAEPVISVAADLAAAGHDLPEVRDFRAGYLEFEPTLETGDVRP